MMALLYCPCTLRFSSVASSILRKFLEGFLLPGAVQVTDHAEDDAIAARRVGEAGHGAGAAPHLAEGAFDNVGGADLAPVGRRKGIEGQQLYQVPFQAAHRARTPGAPPAPPALRNLLGGLPTRGLIHRRRFAHAGAFLLRHLISEVAQLARPAALQGDVRPDQGQPRPQPLRSIHDDQPQAAFGSSRPSNAETPPPKPGRGGLLGAKQLGFG